MNEYKRLMTKQHAIVLYALKSHDQRVVLLDAHHGKVSCFIHNKELPFGAHIEYQLVQKRKYYTAVSINVIRMPFVIAQEDISFLHHVLELCYHFIPEGTCASDVFALVSFIYSSGERLKCSLSKKLYLSKLFILLGMYPEEPNMQSHHWQLLLTQPIEVILVQLADEAIECELNIWLRSCVQVHPLAHTFKTLGFLNT